MFNALTENLLGFYFFARAAAGDHADGAAILKKLCSAYLCDGLYAKLSALCADTDLNEIDSVDAYNRFKRVLSYGKITGAAGQTDPEILKLINLKGGALKAAKMYELDNPAWLSPSAVYDGLAKCAEAGICSVITLLGFFKCEGVFVRKDLAGGLKMLGRAACWNDPCAIILSMKYAPAERARNLNRLYTVWEGAQYGEFVRSFAKAYSLEPVTDENSALTAKAFRHGVVRSEIIDFKYSRVINSNVLSIEERRETVLGGRKELVYEIAALPLAVGGRESLFAVGVDLPFVEKSVQDEINDALKGSDLRRHADYKPLCVCSDEKTVGELCADNLERALADGCNVIRVNAGDVGSGRELTRDNAVLRAVAEKKPNVVFFFAYGAPSADACEGAEKFLRMETRSALRVNLGVTLDMSDVLPVCFCDARNAAAIERFCRVTELQPVGKEGRAFVLKRTLQAKSEQYGFEISLSADAEKALLALGADECAEAVKKAFVKAYSGGNRKFDGEEIGKIIKDAAGKIPSIGFGGANV